MTPAIKPPPSIVKHKKHEREGKHAETLCCLFLFFKGWKILERRFRTPLGEIDIVAKKGHVIAFVEVKKRATLDEAAAAISERQRARLEKAARLFLARNPKFAGFSLRFDAFLTAPRSCPKHIVNAWS